MRNHREENQNICNHIAVEIRPYYPIFRHGNEYCWRSFLPQTSADVDGISRKNNVDRHTWNRVYYDGAWWNVDITTDNSKTANGKELYGFRELEGAFVPDKDFFKMKIY